MEVKKQYPKRIPVSDETHHSLAVLKAERGDNSFDETIRALLDRPNIEPMKFNVGDVVETTDEFNKEKEKFRDRTAGIVGNNSTTGGIVTELIPPELVRLDDGYLTRGVRRAQREVPGL